MKKIYRSNKGTPIDMEAMRLNNEKATAAGNMHVNARGDEIKGGKIIKTAKERVAPHYRAKKEVVHTSIRPPIKKKEAKSAQPQADIIDDGPIVKIRERSNGTSYKEITHQDGSIEIEEIAMKKASRRRPPKGSSSV